MESFFGHIIEFFVWLFLPTPMLDGDGKKLSDEEMRKIKKGISEE